MSTELSAVIQPAPVLLGIDVGTSACKVAAFALDGDVLATASEGYPTFYPEPGWAEQDPRQWLVAVHTAIRTVLASGRVAAVDIAGIGVAGQSWSCIPVDDAGEVLANTPIWLDHRAEAICRRVTERVDETEILALSGNPFKAAYTTPKILWIKENAPDLYQRTRYFLQSNSFVVGALTGSYSQDVCQSYGLHVVDIATGTYDAAMCERLGIDRSKLPDIVACHDVVGGVSAAAAARTGLRQNTPVVAGGLDAACGALGAGVFRTGQTQEQGGQAGGMSIVVDHPVADDRLILSAHVVPDVWLLQAGTVGGGSSLKWIVEQVGVAEDLVAQVAGGSVFAQVSNLAATVPVGSDGLIFLPYMAGERSPIWDAHAKGVLFGLSFATTRAHLYRAVMEGVAYSLEHNIRTASEAGVEIDAMYAVGGAANSDVWTQIKADVTGKTINVPAADTATTLGAAILAGVGVGLYPGFEEATRRTTRILRAHHPDPARHQRYQSWFELYAELYEQLKETMAKASSLLARELSSHVPISTSHLHLPKEEAMRMTFASAPDAVDPSAVPQRTLHTGATVPGLGIGTFGSDRFSGEDIATAVRGALAAGYRFVDCAACYGNEHLIGEVLAEAIGGGLPREHLFVVSKVWNDRHEPEALIASCKKSLADLKLDYLDAYLVHWPFPNFHAPFADTDARSADSRPYVHDDFMRTWRGMETLVDEGLVRHIGTSNMTIAKLDLVLRDARIKPAINEMEQHPCFQQGELFQYCVDHQIQPVGFCPIGSPSRPDRDQADEDLTDIAQPVVVQIAADHGVHPAIICLKWAVQRGQIPIPFSVRRSQYLANLKCATEDPLTVAEIAALRGVDRNNRLIKGQVFLWEGADSWLDLWDVDGTIPGVKGYERA